MASEQYERSNCPCRQVEPHHGKFAEVPYSAVRNPATNPKACVECESCDPLGKFVKIFSRRKK
jgi:hypothetical protein